jgi:hypothetical protein
LSPSTEKQQNTKRQIFISLTRVAYGDSQMDHLLDGLIPLPQPIGFHCQMFNGQKLPPPPSDATVLAMGAAAPAEKTFPRSLCHWPVATEVHVKGHLPQK